MNRTLATITLEERKLRAIPPSIFVPENVFVNGAGQFCSIEATKSYMTARSTHFYVLKNMHTKAALHEALIQGKDILRLGRTDDMNIRVKMTAVFLRLHTYAATQECYDFVKWWKTCEVPDWADNSYPFLDISGADMLEPLYKGLLLTRKSNDLSDELMDWMFARCRPDVNSCIAVTFIKMRLLLQLRHFYQRRDLLLLGTIRATSPLCVLRGDRVILSTVFEFLRPSYACFETFSVAQLRGVEKRLSEQIRTLLVHVESEMNHRIWKAFVNPDKILSATLPSMYAKGSAEEAILHVKQFLPLLTEEAGFKNAAEARGMRQILVEHVGENTAYDLTLMKNPQQPFEIHSHPVFL